MNERKRTEQKSPNMVGNKQEQFRPSINHDGGALDKGATLIQEHQFLKWKFQTLFEN